MAAENTKTEKSVGWLAKQWGEVELELRVLESAAGFYLGTCDADGPYSRESEEYWCDKEEASAALEAGGAAGWTQRRHP